MASRRISIVLEAQIPTRSTFVASRSTGLDSPNGFGEPSVGRRTDCPRVLLKLGLRVSPRSVRKYMPERTGDGPHGGHSDQRWTTFVRNHAEVIVACDFFTVITATFKILYVFVVIDHATRKILHCNVTEHPTAEWMLQQLREAIPSDHEYRFLIRDRDKKFSAQMNQSMEQVDASSE